MDKLTKCKHCGSEICYVIDNTVDIKTYNCMSCGFMTNSLMKEHEEFFLNQVSVLPDIYKDVMYKDEDGLMWMPNVINNPQKGMVFYNGTNKENVQWAAVKAVKVLDEEKKKYPIKGQPGKFYEWRMDMETMRLFPTTNFMEALDYIGVLKD